MHDFRMTSFSQAIGFLGGRFDPVHCGHVQLALDALSALALDTVYFVPSEQTPLKDTSPGAPIKDRLAMLEQVVASDSRLKVLTWELDQGGAVYTIDTARYLAKRWPMAQRYWIIGMDQMAQLNRWKDFMELIDLVEFIVFDRPGYSLGSAPQIPGIRMHHLRGHYLNISSTKLRSELRYGHSDGLCLPEIVSQYIHSHKLYKE